jgi:hypothetical protein
MLIQTYVNYTDNHAHIHTHVNMCVYTHIYIYVYTHIQTSSYGGLGVLSLQILDEGGALVPARRFVHHQPAKLGLSEPVCVSIHAHVYLYVCIMRMYIRVMYVYIRVIYV